MKITKEYLKQIISEELQKVESRESSKADLDETVSDIEIYLKSPTHFPRVEEAFKTILECVKPSEYDGSSNLEMLYDLFKQYFEEKVKLQSHKIG